MNSKISIIVPVYNTAKYLSQCLDSLTGQTFKDIEIICVDDGSTDDSAKIIRSYEQKDDRVRYIHQENAGRSEARNTGLDAVKTPYLMFCDSDDWYDSTMCQKMYDAITQNDVDFAYCGIKTEYEIPNSVTKKSDEEYYRIKFNGIKNITQSTWAEIDASLCNKIFRKALLDKYHLSFPGGLVYEDFCFFFQLLTVSKKMYCLPEYLYHYRRHDGSIMVNTFRQNSTKSLDHIRILDKIYIFLKKNNLWSGWKNTFLDVCQVSFLFGKRYSPNNKKRLAEAEIVSLINKIDLSDTEKEIFFRLCTNSLKEIKLGCFKILKIKSSFKKRTVFFLGIQIYSRKIKKNKEIFSIVYIPVFKRKIKHA